jgi:hypothetical protein
MAVKPLNPPVEVDWYSCGSWDGGYSWNCVYTGELAGAVGRAIEGDHLRVYSSTDSRFQGFGGAANRNGHAVNVEWITIASNWVDLYSDAAHHTTTSNDQRLRSPDIAATIGTRGGSFVRSRPPAGGPFEDAELSSMQRLAVKKLFDAPVWFAIVAFAGATPLGCFHPSEGSQRAQASSNQTTTDLFVAILDVLADSSPAISRHTLGEPVGTTRVDPRPLRTDTGNDRLPVGPRLTRLDSLEPATLTERIEKIRRARFLPGDVTSLDGCPGVLAVMPKDTVCPAQPTMIVAFGIQRLSDGEADVRVLAAGAEKGGRVSLTGLVFLRRDRQGWKFVASRWETISE